MKDKSYGKMCAEDFCIDEDMIWFVPININLLCGYSISDKSITKRIEIPSVTLKKERAFQKIVKVDKYIIGIPYVADYYFKYNKETEEIAFLKYPWINNTNTCPYLSLSVVYDNCVISFRRFLEYAKEEANRVVLFDYEKMELESCWIKEDFDFDYYGSHGVAFRTIGVVENEKLITLQGEISRIIEFDLNKKDIKFNMLPQENVLIETISKIGKDLFCISDRKGSLWIWNRDSNSFKKIENRVIGFSNVYSDEDCFIGSVCIDNKVYFFPYFSNMILEYDIDNDILQEAFFSKEIVDNSYSAKMNILGCENTQFSYPHLCNNKIIVWNLWNKKCYEIDTENKMVNQIDMTVQFSTDEMKNIFAKDFKEGCVSENGRTVFSELNHLIEYLI